MVYYDLRPISLDIFPCKYLYQVLQVAVIQLSESFGVIFSCGPTAQLQPRRLVVGVSRLQTVRYTPGMTPLDEWLACRRGRYLQNKHKRRMSIPSLGFEPAIPAIKRLQTYQLDRPTTGIGWWHVSHINYCEDRNVRIELPLFLSTALTKYMRQVFILVFLFSFVNIISPRIHT